MHTPEDVVKLLLAGADVAMTTSAVLKHGPGLISDLLVGLRTWLEEKEYVSVAQMKGSMSQRNSPDPGAFERANYVKTIRSYVLAGLVKAAGRRGGRAPFLTGSDGASPSQNTGDRSRR